MALPDPRFPYLELSGSPRELGRAHGEAFRDLIAHSLATFAAVLPVPPAVAVRYACASLPYCREHAPDLLEEVAGIAEGSGHTFEEIFALNASLDLLCSDQLRAAEPPDCWASALTAPATASGQVFVTWTAEDSPRWLDSCVLLRLSPAGGVPCLLWTFAGFVGRPGLNPHLGLSAVAAFAPDCGPGLPYPFVCRRALACETTAAALDAITSLARMGGMAYVLGDTSGALAAVSTTARTHEALPARGGWTGFAGDPERLARLEALLRENWGHNGVKELQRIQRDHGPGALCGHGIGGLSTLTAFVADVPNSALWVAYASPCEHEYVKYGL